jgi:hypothetical protein
MTARIHKLLEGEGAGRYLPFALQKAEVLYQQARGGTRTSRWVVGGNFTVSVRVIGEDKFIRITGGCPTFLSGFIDAVLEPGALIEDGPKPVYQVPDPANPEQNIEVLRRFYPKGGATWKDEHKLNETGRTIIGVRASMYSGEMRKVVQVLQGMNVEIPYQMTYLTTHGVFTAGNGSKWIIEIDKSNGVVAYPMSVCNAQHVGGLGYTPLPTVKPSGALREAMQAAGTYIELVTPAAMSAVTGGTFFTYCGWAFNPDGHKAINVYVQADDDKQATRCDLWRLVITEDMDGLKPATATLTSVEHGWIRGPKWVFMKFPDIGGVLQWFDPSYGLLNFDLVCKAPVFAFYDGDTEIVARYHLHPTHTVTVQAEIPPVSATFYRASNEGKELWNRTTLTDGCPHFTVAGSQGLGYLTTYSSATSKQYSAQFIGFGIGELMTIGFMCGDRYVIRLVETQNRAEGQTYDSVFIVPAFDREACYFVDYLVTQRDAYQEIVSYYAASLQNYGAVVTPAGVGCAAAGTLTVSVGSVGGGDIGPFGNGYCVGSDFTGSCTNTWCCGLPPDPPPACSNERYYAAAWACGGFIVAGGHGHYSPSGSRRWNWNGISCVPEDETAVPVPAGSDITIPLSYVTISQARYIASGGLRLGASTGGADMYAFFLKPEGWSDQQMISIRDAFDPKKYIVSPAINKVTGADCMTAVSPYPVAEAGGRMAFVGVPF